MRWLRLLTSFIRSLFATRSQLALENLALRHQLGVLSRSAKRPKLDDNDRIFWTVIRRLLNGWRNILLIAKPETVIKWHRKGWRYYWRRKSLQPQPGRPKIDAEIVELIRRMSKDNFTWGAPRI